MIYDYCIIKYIVYLFSRLYTLRIHNAIKKRMNVIYSLWIRHSIGNVGEATSFKYPLLLQGDGLNHITIGSHCEFDTHCVIGCRETYGEDHYMPQIEIGDYCSFGEYTHISSINKIQISSGLLTGRFVYIGDNAHGVLSMEGKNVRPAKRHLISKGPIIIGQNVWIGDKVSIFAGVTIGDNVIIGAGSIVTHSFPSNCIVAGSPARVVKAL